MNRFEVPAWTTRDTAALAAVALIALTLRLAFAAIVHPTPVSDFGWYYARALEISHGHGYAVHGYPTAYWPPGWPYFLAAAIFIFGPSIFALTAIQSVLGSLTAAVVFLLGRRIFGRLAGAAAGMAYALLPSGIEWSATLASEPLYTFLWAVATYIWVSCCTRQVGWYALSGLILGFAALVRPSALFLGLVLLLYLLTVKNERRDPARVAVSVSVAFLSMIVVISPLLVRDYRVFGRFVLISNNGGVSLYQANNDRAVGTYTELDNAEISRLISDPRTEVQGDRLASQLATRYIVSHPRRELFLVLQRLKGLYDGDNLAIRFTLRSNHFHEPVSPPPTDRTATLVAKLNRVTYFALMLFALFGIVACFLSKSSLYAASSWRLLLGMILYNTATYALIFGLDRYRYPTMPYFAVFAGAGIVGVLALVRQRTTVRLTSRIEVKS